MASAAQSAHDAVSGDRVAGLPVADMVGVVLRSRRGFLNGVYAGLVFVPVYNWLAHRADVRARVNT